MLAIIRRVSSSGNVGMVASTTGACAISCASWTSCAVSSSDGASEKCDRNLRSMSSPRRINSRKLRDPLACSVAFHCASADTSAKPYTASSGQPLRVSHPSPVSASPPWGPAQYPDADVFEVIRWNNAMNLGARLIDILATISIN